MNIYTKNNKLNLQKLALKAYQEKFSDPIIGLITKKDYFWYISTNKNKYIYKPALEFYYSPSDSQNKQNANEIFSFYRTMNKYGNFFPKLEEVDDFFIMTNDQTATPITSLNKIDITYIRENYTKSDFTPFCYNSMAFNIVRNKTNELYIVDIKHINKVPNNMLFAYFYNREFKINKFYEIENLTKSERENIFRNLSIDYDVDNSEYFTRENID